ncbi:MAG: alkene reductase [Desulforhopalus sp.]
MKNLFTPLQLGPIQLKNRMIMAPLTRGRAGESRIPNDLMKTYYTQRATAGLIITEATAISEDGYGWLGAPAIYNDDQQQGWREITSSVHKEGGRIFLQLWHMGRVSHPDFQNGQVPVGPSPIAAAGETTTPQGKKPYVTPKALTEKDMQRVVKKYAEATERSLEAGFDGVEIHSANGYLLDQFLRDGSNQRDDEYGGSIENRIRFPLQVVDAVVKVASKERVGLRISPVNPFNDMKDSNPKELFTLYSAELAKREIVYLHVLEALPGHFLYAEGQEPVLKYIRESFPGTLIVNGGYDLQISNDLLASNGADAVAFGTLFIANPDLVQRFRKEAELNTPDTATFYTAGAKGYTDYPFMMAS